MSDGRPDVVAPRSPFVIDRPTGWADEIEHAAVTAAETTVEASLWCRCGNPWPCALRTEPAVGADGLPGPALGGRMVTLVDPPSIDLTDARTSQHAVRLRIGTLDHESAQQVRQVLRHIAARPNSSVVVDLVGLDDQHELTLFAMLAEAVSETRTNGGTLVALHPPERLAVSLIAAGTTVVRHGAGPEAAPDAERIDVGVLPRSGADGNLGQPTPYQRHAQIMVLDAGGDSRGSGRCICGARWPCPAP